MTGHHITSERRRTAKLSTLARDLLDAYVNDVGDLGLRDSWGDAIEEAER